MTPFRSGFPVDAIPHVDMSPEDRVPLIAKMQSWMGMNNWLQQCTRPDFATIYSLLASYMHCPSPGHLEAVNYVGKYILSTMHLGLLFTSKSTASLESFIHFPLPNPHPVQSSSCPLMTFCDANWGPQDASHPSPLHQYSACHCSRVQIHLRPYFLLWGVSHSMENPQGEAYQSFLL